MRKKLPILISILAIAVLFGIFGNHLLITFENNKESHCYGTSKKGKIKNSKRLPSRGDNFVTYSYLGSTLGRSSVHSKVKKIILESYLWLSQNHPKKIFVYGETGWPSGGKFFPHKTHQNGTSVDFMVPLKDEQGHSATMKTNLFNKWGYGLDVDKNGKLGNEEIDFEAMALHLYSLKIKAKENNTKIWRVIFDPSLQKHLLNTEYGNKIKDMNFSKKPSWVRHDDHYHVDFDINCEAL